MDKASSGVSSSQVVVFDRYSSQWSITRVEVPGQESQLTASKSGDVAISTEIEADVFSNLATEPTKITLPENTDRFVLLDEKNRAYLQVHSPQDHVVHVIFLRLPDADTTYSVAIASADWHNIPVSSGGVIFVRSRQECTFGEMSTGGKIDLFTLRSGRTCMTILRNLDDGRVIVADRSKLLIVSQSGEREQIARQRGFRWYKIKDRTANEGVIEGTYTGWWQVLWRKCLNHPRKSRYLVDFRRTFNAAKVTSALSDKVALSEDGTQIATFEASRDFICIEDLEMSLTQRRLTLGKAERKCLSVSSSLNHETNVGVCGRPH